MLDSLVRVCAYNSGCTVGASVVRYYDAGFKLTCRHRPEGIERFEHTRNGKRKYFSLIKTGDYQEQFAHKAIFYNDYSRQACLSASS